MIGIQKIGLPMGEKGPVILVVAAMAVALVRVLRHGTPCRVVIDGEAQSASMTPQGAENAATENAPDESTESVVAAS